MVSSIQLQSLMIPANSQFYSVRQNGRISLPERYEQLFVERFAEVTNLAPRDYRDIYETLQKVALDRGYIDPNRPTTTITVFCNGVWNGAYRMTTALHRVDARRNKVGVMSVQLYVDVFVAAVLACPVAEKDIYM